MVLNHFELKRSAVAIAPDSVVVGYGLEYNLPHIRSANRISLQPPFESHFLEAAIKQKVAYRYSTQPISAA